MQRGINPLVAVALVIVALLGIGLLGWKLTTLNSEPQVTVKAANPDDPKFRPDPKIGVASGGATAPQGNTSD